MGRVLSLSTTLHDELCDLMSKLVVKSNDVLLCDNSTVSYALNGSFVSEQVTDQETLKLIAETWIDIEDQPEIIDLEIEEAEENLEMKSVSYVSDDDTDEEQSGDISSKQAQETIIPTYLEALNSIQIAVEYAKSKCDAELLQKLESAMYYLQQSKMKEQKSQQVLTAFFKKIT